MEKHYYCKECEAEKQPSQVEVWTVHTKPKKHFPMCKKCGADAEEMEPRWVRPSEGEPYKAFYRHVLNVANNEPNDAALADEVHHLLEVFEVKLEHQKWCVKNVRVQG